MVNLDGSHGEGGGQMLRTALVWSLISQTPFRMQNIRAGREKPGLKAQHVHVLKSLRSLGPVAFTGATEGSSAVTFTPAPLSGRDFTVDIGTAGSITLLLQTLLPAALMAAGRSRIVMIGGSDVAWSPPFDYLREIILPHVAPFAGYLRLEIDRRGFHPRGGARVILECEGFRERRPFALEQRGALRKIEVLSVASESLAERQVAERQSVAAAHRLRRYQPAPILSQSVHVPAFSPGSVVTCVAEFEDGTRLGGNALGERRKRAEEVGRNAADALMAEIESGAAVDSHAADQLLGWLALAGGVLRVGQLTEHTRTHIWVIEQFLGPVFEVEVAVIRCKVPYARLLKREA